MKTNRSYIYIGMCVAVLPLLLLRDVTPDNELRYLSIVDEALRTHTFFAFTNHGAPYADKPPLYLWLVMLCRWLTGGHHVWLLSLFSVIPALLVARVMDSWVASELDERGRTMALALLLTSGFFLGAAVVLRMDMLMCLFIVLALRSFWRLYTDDTSASERWLFPLWLFLAVFTKGPLGLLIPFSATVVFLAVKGQLYTLCRYWGWRTWGVLAAACAVWFGLTFAEGGTDYLGNLLVHQTVGRAVNAFHHKAPFYYYAVAFWYMLAPWSLLVAVGLVVTPTRRVMRSDLQRFFFVVAVTTFFLLSCVSAKLQIYLLPALPFMVYAVALSMQRMSECRWVRVTVVLPAVILALALPALFTLVRLTDLPYIRTWQLAASAYILTVVGVFALYLLRQQRVHLCAPVLLMAFGVLAAVFVASFAMSRLNPSLGYGSVCEKALELANAKPQSHLATWRVRRAENLDAYFQRTPFRVLPDEQVPKLERGTLLILPKQEQKPFEGRKMYDDGEFVIVEF